MIHLFPPPMKLFKPLTRHILINLVFALCTVLARIVSRSGFQAPGTRSKQGFRNAPFDEVKRMIVSLFRYISFPIRAKLFQNQGTGLGLVHSLVPGGTAQIPPNSEKEQEREGEIEDAAAVFFAGF